jgi:hypothetical protein
MKLLALSLSTMAIGLKYSRPHAASPFEHQMEASDRCRPRRTAPAKM